MQQNSLERVREDLATIRVALGTELPYGSTDVYFYAGLSAAGGLFAVSHALGAHRGWPLFLSALPALLVFAVYMGYMAVKWRWHANLSTTRRKEYRTALLIVAPLAVAAVAGRQWAARAGMSHLQFGGAASVVMGALFVLIGLTNLSANRYPRSYWLALGLPFIAFGLLLPFCTQTQALVAAGCMVSVIFALLAIVMHCSIRGQDERTRDAAD